MTHTRFLKINRRDLRSLPLLLVMIGGLGGLIAKGHHLATREPWVPAFVKTGVRETVLIFVGSSTCGWSKAPELKKALRAARTGLRAEANRRGETFASIGISVDVVVQDGVEYLMNMGPFDEIATGRSWANSASLKYVWGRELGGKPETPQIILVERVLGGPNGEPLVVSDERVLLRRTGTEEIARWSREAFPIHSSKP